MTESTIARMSTPSKSSRAAGTVVIIGAGIGGLAAALRLAHAGRRVIVLERHGRPGGKMRSLPSSAGPVDAGPTVLTLSSVFEELFASVGERLSDHVRLVRQPCLARHFWPDGSRLDLFDTRSETEESIRAFAGTTAMRQFRTFSARAQTLFEGFDAPVMQNPDPRLPGLALYCARNPGLIRKMAPFSTLADLLDSSFDDPRLAQLFGRYATYVGGSPYRVPALMSLVWHAEARGVWSIEGGLHRLPEIIAALAQSLGGEFVYNAHVARIDANGGEVDGVTLADGQFIPAGTVLFNGDPRALATGALGAGATGITARTGSAPRSLSAEVWAFAASADGPELAHHNVFFRGDPKPEFDALQRGETIDSPTLYVCAMDRGQPGPTPTCERFEIIANAPPQPDNQPEDHRCRTRTFQTLATFDLTFDPLPGPDALTTPARFDQLFPASAGSLYGQSPHGMMAAFQRPTAKTAIRGLYLAGGGTHPGAGVPMAALSGRHAAAAILGNPTSISPFRRTGTLGGTSTGSARPAAGPSASSGS
nr:1-hydroxycarotenoid 3,4-desaturase CrtD [Roseovarius sp. TE539]